MTAWRHLPNAHHIDWVISSVKANPGLWSAARSAACSAAMYAARNAAYGALFALVAWDSSGDLLGAHPDQVETLALLGDHRAVLMLPAVKVWAKEHAII